MDAAQARGGMMVLQMWRVGRISHTSLQLGGKAAVAPSAIRARAKASTANGFEAISEPRALAASEMPRIIAEYR